MSCVRCDLGPHEHEGGRQVYIPGKGWLKPCDGYEAAPEAHGVVVPGRTAARSMLRETFKFAEKKKHG